MTVRSDGRPPQGGFLPVHPGRLLDLIRMMPERYGRPGVGATYLAPLDGLRALAIALVVCWHVSVRVFRLTMVGPFDASDNAGFLRWVPHGEIGVSLFFFISGFIIVRPFMNGSQGMSLPEIGRFFLRRLLRIAPPHVILVTLAFVALAVAGYRPERAVNFDAAHQSLPASYGASLLFINGLVFHTPPRLNPPTWSLEIEMQFYLFSPFIVMSFLAYQRWTRGGVLSFLPSLTAAGIVTVVIGCLGAYSPFRWTLVSYLHLFLLGVLVASCEVSGRSRIQIPARRYDVLFLLGFAVLVFTGLFRDWNSFGAVGLRVFATMFAVSAMFYGAVRGRRAPAVLANRWIALLGAMSYSIYLTHVAVIQLALTLVFRKVEFNHDAANLLLAAACGVPLVILAGAAYYIAIERRFLRVASIVFPLRRAPSAAFVP